MIRNLDESNHWGFGKLRGDKRLRPLSPRSRALRPREIAASLHSSMSGETGNTTMSGDYEDYEDYDTVNDDGVSYNVSPDVPPFVYIISCCFMAIICVFGVVSNSSIFVLFINSPLVSSECLLKILKENYIDLIFRYELHSTAS